MTSTRRAVEPQQRHPLAAHALGHGQHQLVALGRADEGQRDAGVAARRLDDRRAAGLDPPLPLGVLDHRHADPVLDAAARVERLELGEQPRLRLGDIRVSWTIGVEPTCSAMLLGIPAIPGRNPTRSSIPPPHPGPGEGAPTARAGQSEGTHTASGC